MDDVAQLREGLGVGAVLPFVAVMLHSLIALEHPDPRVQSVDVPEAAAKLHEEGEDDRDRYLLVEVPALLVLRVCI